MRQRLLGAFLFATGAVLAYLCIYKALQHAANHEDSVSVFLKGTIIVPVGLVLGAMYLVLGERVKTVLGTREEPTTTAWAVGIGCLAVGGLLYFWLRACLQRMGYGGE